MRLNRKFFNRSTVIVAKELLGKYLCRRLNGKTIRSKITEVEAYCGPKDRANHASKGVTPRTKIMFGPPGYAYIYMIYGMYYCLNFVTEREGYPAAVLIRGCELSSKYNVLSIKGKDRKDKSTIHNTNPIIQKLKGPGRLCREFKIDKKLNGTDISKSRELWVEDSRDRPKKIKKGKRIGIDYAGKWKDKLWRFYI